MKKIILTLAALAICSTATLAQENKFAIGAGVGASNHFFKGDNTVLPLPFFDIRYDNFFMVGTNIGYDVISEDSVTLSLFVNPLDGFFIRSKDIDSDYDSIDDRKTQVAVGATVGYDLPFYDIKTLLSISGGERGAKSSAHILKPYRFDDKLTLIPSFSATFYTDDYTDYYFGVDHNELGGNLTHTYSPDDAYSLGLSLAAEYYLNDRITLLAFLSADKFSSEVADSPLIDNDVVLKMGVGAKYSF